MDNEQQNCTNQEFLVIDGALMVRECGAKQQAYDILGQRRGSRISVIMRPATLPEVMRYRGIHGI